jgi:ABC-2 type transport system permease protein
MSAMLAIYRRELLSYFSTPLAAIFIVIFLLLSSSFTFFLGNFFQIGQADLQAFFQFHPWLYLLLVPALSMRLWSEERKTGTIELLLTLPVSVTAAVMAKFFAAWTLVALALLLTLPMWISVAWLGDPDHGVIVASYAGSWLMAGGFLAIGGAISAATRSQVTAFIITLLVCLIAVLAGFPIVLSLFQGVLQQQWVDAISGLSFLMHYESITRGVLNFSDLAFFLIQMLAWLLTTVLVVHFRKVN